ncbi:hypothetical protein [Ferruginivarius sediminum]|uniref:Uncharacterized protein n=1 Tax=Ferruginivarius sediminum TaxID=2661937 RepID=A0A369TCC1_9PROT|nr:hypothetical protein [Ferruginivarius sediminum]RDD62055.1 hypothetical protein DRB17_09450 [Ferruginivarius sediminum]
MQHRHLAAAEPSIAELLADPIVRLLMARDGVGRRDIETLIENLDLRGSNLRFTSTDRPVVPPPAASRRED